MNELHAKFEREGLTILGVTEDDKGKTEAWVKAKKAAYPYAFDPGGGLRRWFGINGIPHAVLVDPSGKVVWRGSPFNLEEPIVAHFLRKVWPVEVRNAIEANRFSQALEVAQKMAQGYPALAPLLAEPAVAPAS